MILQQRNTILSPSRGQEQAYYKGNRVGLVSDKRNLIGTTRTISFLHILEMTDSKDLFITKD
jgi:hypothetical protein